jgi:RHS repeat-associated protein
MKGMATTRNPTNFNKFQFLNRETQFETGYIDLIHRQFDPTIARFTSQDPVIEGQEHVSLYQYSWNNPILKSDPDGMWPGGPSTLQTWQNFKNGIRSVFDMSKNYIKEKSGYNNLKHEEKVFTKNNIIISFAIKSNKIEAEKVEEMLRYPSMAGPDGGDDGGIQNAIKHSFLVH